MVKYTRFVVVVAGFAGLFAGKAVAADMPGEFPPPLPAPAPAKVEWLKSGWYVRGDLGWHMGRLSSADAAAPFADQSGSLGNGLTAGLGVGIKSNWLRTDATFDYASPVTYSGPGTTAKIQSNTFLFNAYVDLGTWHRLTPYVGGGVGASRVSVSDYQSTTAPPFTGGTNRSEWNFAWAGMAGVAWAVAPNLELDIGYRYLNVGDVTTGSDAFGAMTFKNVGAHEVRAGLRWSLNDLRNY